MIKILLLTVLLSACGGSSTPEKPPIIKPPVKDTLIIHRNTDNTSLNGASIDNEAIILSAVFSQSERDRLEQCNYTCFNLNESVILGDDKDCIDCYDLSKFLNFYERDHDVMVFITVEDELTFGFVEGMASMNGYSNIVLVSSSEELLLNAEYNYSNAIIGESSNVSIDWHITSNSECSAKCINPDGVGVGLFDGVIYP